MDPRGLRWPLVIALLALSVTPIAALVATVAHLDILGESAQGWPVAATVATIIVMLPCGLLMLYRSVVAADGILLYIIGGLWISGASVFSRTPLSRAGWDWPETWPALLAFYVATGFVIRSEWKHRPAFAVALTFAVLWPCLGWPFFSLWFLWLNGALGTAALITCSIDSVGRYQPQKEKIS